MSRAVNAAIRSKVLDPNRVRELFGYDSDEGFVTRLYGVRAGVPVTSHTEGGRFVVIDGVTVMCSHIVWVLTYGRRPFGAIRYRDGDVTNLRLDNLYETGEAQIDSVSASPNGVRVGWEFMGRFGNKNIGRLADPTKAQAATRRGLGGMA